MLRAGRAKPTLTGAVLPGGYRLLEEIGEGGFGCVYRAVQGTSGQTVAIKLLRAGGDLTQDGAQRYVARFQRELSLCARLCHPNIVRLSRARARPCCCKT